MKIEEGPSALDMDRKDSRVIGRYASYYEDSHRDDHVYRITEDGTNLAEVFDSQRSGILPQLAFMRGRQCRDRDALIRFVYEVFGSHTISKRGVEPYDWS